MRHLNEQTETIARSISDASRMKGIQWNRVTWYSWWLAVVIFCVVVPALSFYIGTQYAETKEVIRETRIK